MWKFNVVFQFALVAICAWCASAHLGEHERSAMMEAMKPIGKECMGECGLEEGDFKHDDVPPCMKKCFLKKVKVIDDNGMYDSEMMQKHMSEFIKNEDEVKKMKDKFESCFNEKGDNVTEGEEAEMKRIEVMIQCMKEMKP